MSRRSSGRRSRRSRSEESDEESSEEEEAPTAHAIDDVELVQSSRNLMANNRAAQQKPAVAAANLQTVEDTDDDSDTKVKKKRSKVWPIVCGFVGVAMVIVGAGFMLRYRNCELCG